jgi:hypothetical protein
MKKNVSSPFTKTAIASAVGLAFATTPALAQVAQICETPETASLVVTINSNTIDDCDYETSLAEAIDFANQNAGPDTITFASELTGDIEFDGVVNFNTANIFDDLNIQGPGVDVDGLSIVTLRGQSLNIRSDAEYSTGPKNVTISHVGLNNSNGESNFIEFNAPGGSLTLDSIQMIDGSSASLIHSDTSTTALAYGGDADKLEVKIKDSIISGSQFLSSVINLYQYDSYNEQALGIDVTIENSRFESVSASGRLLIDAETYSYSEYSTQPVTVKLEQTTISGGDFNGLIIAESFSYSSEGYGGPSPFMTSSESSADNVSLVISNSDIEGVLFNDYTDAFSLQSDFGGSSMLLENSSLKNMTLPYGGLIAVSAASEQAQLELINSQVTGNTLSSNTSFSVNTYNGAAILKVTDSEVTDNTLQGAHLFNISSPPFSTYGNQVHIENSRISNNNSSYSYAYGGSTNFVISSSAETISLNNSEISNNSLGAINSSAPKYNDLNINIQQSTISGNSDAGLKVRSYSESPSPSSGQINVLLSNSTISANSYGGIDIFTDRATSLTVANSTIAENVKAYGYGAGIAINSSSENVQATISNSIISGNTTSNGEVSYTSNLYGNFDIDYSLIDTVANSDNGYGGSSINGISYFNDSTDFGSNVIISSDTGLQPLAYRGGALVHALKSTSPAVATGNASAEDLPATDQIGQPRLRDGSELDMGAVQSVATSSINNDLFIMPDGAVEGYINVLHNDLIASDIDVGTVYIDLLNFPQFGEAIVGESNDVIYTPDESFAGIDALSYQVFEEDGTLIGQANVAIGNEQVEEAIEREKRDSDNGSSSGILLFALSLLGLGRLRRKQH